MYSPGNPPSTNLADLARYLASEQAKIAQAIDAPRESVRLVPLTQPPKRLYDGMIVYALAPWNPGSGNGTYERRGGAWVKL